MTDAADWQARVGDVWAAEWRRTDRSMADLSRHLDAAILTAAPAGSATAVDLGCGAGATGAALDTARPDLAITGVDLSPALVAIARARVPAARFHVGDVERDPLPVAPDFLVSRHGLMFFADPVAAFARLAAQARPNATLVFSCYRDRVRNALAGDLVAALTGACPTPSASYAPGPFAFASRDLVGAILETAGWRVVSVASVDFGYVAGGGTAPIADAIGFLSRIGPLARILADGGSDAAARLSAALVRYRVDDRVILPASAWIWRATKGQA